MSAIARPRPLPLAATTVAAAGVAWLGTVQLTGSMGMSASAGAADAGIFLGAWAVMMAAMMLPSALPMLLLYARAASSHAAALVFAGGYLLVWTAFGAVAYLAFALVRGRFVAMGDMASLGRPAAALVLGAAALYQLSPLKRACLKHCRSPLAFLLHGWRSGLRGALRMGAAHGAWCVGCCTGPMLVLFALGVMNLTVMVAVALAVLAEKAAPFGVPLSRAAPAVLAGLAVAVAASPGVYAWLT